MFAKKGVFSYNCQDTVTIKQEIIMGKGDKKTKRGKIAKGTYGVSRPRPSNQDTTTEKAEKKSGEKTAKKKPAKKKSEKK